MGLTIGCHLSIAKGYRAIAEEAVSLGANTFQFFTRNPRGGKAKAIDPADVASFRAYAAEQGIERILAHAPYTLNPASATEKTRDFARMALAEDLARMENTPGQLYNMHPGSHVGAGRRRRHRPDRRRPRRGASRRADDDASARDHGGQGQRDRRTVRGAGGDHRAGRAARSGRVPGHLPRHGMPDTTSRRLDGVLRSSTRSSAGSPEAVHLNDRLNPRGARKDRHARIGEGFIGFEALSAVTPSLLRDLPFLLSGDAAGGLSNYADEIARLRRLGKVTSCCGLPPLSSVQPGSANAGMRKARRQAICRSPTLPAFRSPVLGCVRSRRRARA